MQYCAKRNNLLKYKPRKIFYIKTQSLRVEIQGACGLPITAKAYKLMPSHTKSKYTCDRSQTVLQRFVQFFKLLCL